ncbi:MULTISPECIES: hypothetical protein [Paraburkholderia]|uniref:Uncharacterized protein n=1 Tax=Paraburkholderia madseniana TaxID=2599607 RepID=A0AAP5BM14_9BURK|nr:MULTISPECIES: hypothetical protein [Paraburkholderia]MCX4151977.1 hypothetical protein [Paraburkholderia madseniana]MCX4175604.1 hypothetical protein [Paraburkholderia madseniana]MDN7154905.1 hypothetical protein [Paraburkholderia sp. WS6]MDQ6413788.1 hypothetical protein [Paraburkholderia madseniana]MDQ6463600.1 hypothetical protein [Paraburkholderia madseniana]
MLYLLYIVTTSVLLALAVYRRNAVLYVAAAVACGMLGRLCLDLCIAHGAGVLHAGWAFVFGVQP